jgi:hypothetical protein
VITSDAGRPRPAPSTRLPAEPRATDGDPTSSDGIFVFMGSFTSLIGGYVPTVGDEVVLRGRVSEFNSFTQLSGTSMVRKLASGLDVNTEVEVVDAVPPVRVADALRFFERNEGVRLRVRAGSGATSGRDLLLHRRRRALGDRPGRPLLARADGTPAGCSGTPTRWTTTRPGSSTTARAAVLLGSMGVMAAPGQHRDAAAGAHLRHGDRGRVRRGLLLVLKYGVQVNGSPSPAVPTVEEQPTAVGEPRREWPWRHTTWRTCTTTATTRSTAATSSATRDARA